MRYTDPRSGKTRTLPKTIPAHGIEWLVGQYHVSTPAEDIEADIRRRTKRTDGWTPAAIEHAIGYALACHVDNRRVYAYVMRPTPSAPRA